MMVRTPAAPHALDQAGRARRLASLSARTGVRALPALVVVAALAGCGGGSSSSGGTTAAPTSAPAARIPSVDGKIVQVTGSTMQVQGSGSQSAVSWTDATTITAQADATVDDVTTGACVMAFTQDDVATTVQISTPTDGTCGGNRPPGNGTRPTDMPDGWPTDMPSGMPTDMPGDRPTDMPTDMPSGMPTDMARQMNGTSGQVTGVSGTTVTVTTGDDSTSTFTVGPDTTYTKRVTADASALVVGQCVSARGEADKAGNLAATSIEVSTPTDGACTSVRVQGPGRPGGPGGQGGQGAPGAQGGTGSNG